MSGWQKPVVGGDGRSGDWQSDDNVKWAEMAKASTSRLAKRGSGRG